MIVLEFSISSYKNENFYNSLDEIETLSLAIKIVNGSNLLLFIDKMTYTDFEMLINDREVLKSDVLKMTYPKQIANNFSQFLQAINAKMTIITGARGSKSNPTQEELIRIFDSELFFTDSIGAIWLFSDGNNKFKVQEWK
jgi:beta-lactamase superfamily II metal-dependent hydrolase